MIFYDDDFDLLEMINLEMAISVDASLRNMMEHMLKYQYNPSKQTSSWVSTIARSYNELNSNSNTLKISEYELDEIYKESYERASKQNNIPKELKYNRPSEWTIHSLTNEEYIRNFLYTYINKSPIYPIDIDKIFCPNSGNKKNNKKRK